MSVDTKYAVFASAGQRSRHIIAGAYSRYEIIPSIQGEVAVNNTVLMGYGNAGQPHVTNWVTDAEQARQILGGGDLYEKIRYAFNPKGRSGNLRPQQLGFMVVNTNTRATVDLEGGAGADDVVRLSSKAYGGVANQVQFKIEAGTVSGKKFTEKYLTSVNVYDNIDAIYLTIRYIGVGSASAMTIDGTNLTITCTGAASDNITLPLAGVTVSGLAAILAAVDDGASYQAVVSPAYQDSLISELDWVTAIDIKTATYSTRAILKAFIDKVNDSAQYVTAALIGDRKVVDNVASYTALTGATNGSYTVTEWGQAFTAMRTVNAQYVLPCLPNDTAILALLSEHLNWCASVDGKAERIGIYGIDNLGTAIAQAVALGNRSLQIVHGLITNYNSSAQLVEFDSAMYGAQLAGQKAALDIGESCGFENVNAVSARIDTANGTLTSALEAGVTALEITASGKIRTNRELTTYQGDELELALPSVVAEIYFMQRSLRALVEEKFTGRKATVGRLAAIDALSKDKLSDYENVDKIIIGLSADQPAYWDYLRTLDGNVVNISFNARLAAPMEFQFITTRLTIQANVA